RGSGALRPHPAVRRRGLPQPPETTHAARGRPDGELRLWAATSEGVGEEPGGALTLQHLSARRTPTRPDRPARPRRSRRGTLPRGRAVPVLRGAARRQAHLFGHLWRALGRDPARQAISARSARVAAAAPAASATSTRSFTITGTASAPTSARASARTSSGAASFSRTWMIVAPRPPATAWRQVSTGSRPLRTPASVITIKRS